MMRRSAAGVRLTFAGRSVNGTSSLALSKGWQCPFRKAKDPEARNRQAALEDFATSCLFRHAGWYTRARLDGRNPATTAERGCAGQRHGGGWGSRPDARTGPREPLAATPAGNQLTLVQ